MEINLEEFQTLLSQLTSFDKMYEQVRFVDPVKKEVLFVKHKNQEEIIPVLEPCFGIWGEIDIWINNAGQNTTRVFSWETDGTCTENIIKTNLIGMIYGSQIAATGMLKQGHGAIYRRV